MDKKLRNKIIKREKEGTLRSLSSYEGMIDFVSNDYLGLKNVSFDNGKSFSASTGSRLISGNSDAIISAEATIAEFFGWESGLCFNSGYDANLGIFSSIPQKGDIVLYDEYIHASVRDGIRLSTAKAYSFKHNDVTDLERLIKKFPVETIYIAVEGLYSMHGDICALGDIEKLVGDERIHLIVDEAHSCGVLGPNGKGITSELGIDSKVYLKLVTYGKAYGGHGACVLSDKETTNYLINFARSFIYTTALPIDSYVYMAKILHLDDLKERIERLQNNISLFRLEAKDLDLVSDCRSPIQVIRAANVGQLKKVQLELTERNFAVKLVLPPTVQQGEECIRVCIHEGNTEVDIRNFVAIILQNN